MFVPSNAMPSGAMPTAKVPSTEPIGETLVTVLVLQLGRVLSPSGKQRLYEWSFLVVGKPCDRLGLFGAEPAADELAVEDLLALIWDLFADRRRKKEAKP